MYHVTTFDLDDRIHVSGNHGGTVILRVGGGGSVAMAVRSVETIDKLRAALMVARDALEANEDAA